MKKELIVSDYFEEYERKQRFTIAKHLRDLRKSDFSLSFAFVRSSIFSSMIEGSSIDMDNYFLSKESSFQNTEIKQIDDLVEAYKFARSHALNEKNIMKAYEICSRNLAIPNEFKGVIRNREVEIKSWTGKTVYGACNSKHLPQELEKFYNDLALIKKRKIYSLNEAFYFASLAHLVFVNIHPFADGNGRVSRLIEKWLLAEITKNPDIWKLPSEINYWIRREVMYSNLNILGSGYEKLDYSKALPFLLMLPSSFGISKKFLK